MLINGIVAMCNNNGIGVNNKLPWHLPDDLKRFQKMTSGAGNNAVILGKNTWKSIPFLKNRDHLILSSSMELDYTKNGKIVKTFASIDGVSEYCEERKYDKLWVIGGAQTYRQYLESNTLDYLYVTYIHDDYKCDTFFPTIPDTYFRIQNTPLSEVNERCNNTYLLIYKKAKVGMNVIHNHNTWTICTIQNENNFKTQFTIQFGNDTYKTVTSKQIRLKV